MVIHQHTQSERRGSCKVVLVRESGTKRPFSIKGNHNLLTLILTLNNFVFNDVNYVQVKGASMCTKCAPTYASLFISKFEKTHILPGIRNHTLMYIRYVDDMFMMEKL